MGHTDTIYEEALLGFENGYTLATHFYSCMSGVTRKNALRYAGVVEAGYLIDEMDVEIIADGIHLPSPLLKLIVKIKGNDADIVIFDDDIRVYTTIVNGRIIYNNTRLNKTDSLVPLN